MTLGKIVAINKEAMSLADQAYQAIKKRRSEEAQRPLRAHIEQSRLEVRRITLGMLYQARTRNRRAPRED